MRNGITKPNEVTIDKYIIELYRRYKHYNFHIQNGTLKYKDFKLFDKSGRSIDTQWIEKNLYYSPHKFEELYNKRFISNNDYYYEIQLTPENIDIVKNALDNFITKIVIPKEDVTFKSLKDFDVNSYLYDTENKLFEANLDKLSIDFSMETNYNIVNPESTKARIGYRTNIETGSNSFILAKSSNSIIVGDNSTVSVKDNNNIETGNNCYCLVGKNNNIIAGRNNIIELNDKCNILARNNVTIIKNKDVSGTVKLTSNASSNLATYNLDQFKDNTQIELRCGKEPIFTDLY